ncbi:MAG: ATP synthase F1 subunit gamma [Candidatus Peribacteraceae bacterium]|nr:ATP synthase F1 subunit gamma [Candidatus Peribacteraceae bacterium]
MARSLRDIRRKIKGITSTRQVTKAMELVSASKMRKAINSAHMLRQYAQAAWDILQHIAQANPGAHPYLQERPLQNVLIVLISTDRGLCGSLNTQLFRALNLYLQELKKIETFETVDYIAVGRKGQQYLARTGQKIIAAFPAFSNHPRYRDALPVARLLTESFKAGSYDHVIVLYPDFVSALVQEPEVKVLLPFSQSEVQAMAEEFGLRRRPKKKRTSSSSFDHADEFKFEPSVVEVLDSIMPQLTEVQLYQAVLEAGAAEHSARMVAMRNATDNASDILDDLTLTYNQTRQANTTTELSELSAATAAIG